MTQFRTQNNYGKTLDGFFEIFNEIPSALGKTMREDVFSFPPVNITEKAASYHIQVSAPGMEKSDFSIKLDGNLLSVSAEKKEKEAALSGVEQAYFKARNEIHELENKQRDNFRKQ